MLPKQRTCSLSPSLTQHEEALKQPVITTLVLPYSSWSLQLPLPESELQHLFKGKGKQQLFPGVLHNSFNVLQRLRGLAKCTQDIPAQVTANNLKKPSAANSSI